MVVEFLRQFAGLQWLLVLMSSSCVAWGFINWQRQRLIEDVPTAKIRSAAQGYVELIGEAVMMQGEPVIAPLSGTPCCWYAYSVEEVDSHRRSHLRSGESDHIFKIRDATGECVIDPDLAEVTTTHSTTWSGNEFQRLNRRAQGGINAKLSVWAGDNYRYTEKVILSGDPLYVIGEFQSLGNRLGQESKREITKSILREWKADQKKLMERFDTNHDGKIDLNEWEQAREAAKKQAVEEYEKSHQEQPLHLIKAPTKGRFLISNKSERELIKTYRFWSNISFILAVMSGLLALTLFWAK